ncbi:MAG TPA: MmcQ/YjbR family DNA-binding protein [Planctomycetota bacterium]|nr:MmcQ/YjbR family DNA-binding protein [Planctomycetota bacterium]
MKKVQATLRELALGLPGATEEFPWGERVVKAGGKVFVFLGRDEPHESWGMSVKLPISGPSALDQPFAEPTGYGLGKSGWVTASFEPGERPPLELLSGWILESYRAIAPKRRLAELDGAAPATPTKARRKRSK